MESRPFAGRLSGSQDEPIDRISRIDVDVARFFGFGGIAVHYHADYIKSMYIYSSSVFRPAFLKIDIRRQKPIFFNSPDEVESSMLYLFISF